MKIMITGGKGMLGRSLQIALSEHELFIADLPGIDVTQAPGFEQALRKSGAELLIHCAAMTAVDLCESNVEEAFRLNAWACANVAAACQRNQVRLIAISTDYVFDGRLERPYHEFDLPNGGDSIYGQSKLAGEELIRRHCPNHLIARISWLYGPGGPSFVHTMLRLAGEKPPLLKVVNDQVGNPSSTLAVARALKNLIEIPELVGTFHLSCEGETSWYGFAKEIFRLHGIKQALQPCSSLEFPRPAPRPANSRLEKRMLRLCGLPPMPQWQDSLQEFLRTL